MGSGSQVGFQEVKEPIGHFAFSGYHVIRSPVRSTSTAKGKAVWPMIRGLRSNDVVVAPLVRPNPTDY